MRLALRKMSTRIAAVALGLLFVALRLSMRVRVVADPRPALRRRKQPYIYALLHAHQLAAVMASDEGDLAAMVSRSADGDLLVPALRWRGILPVRGSSQRGNRNKGGTDALGKLTMHVQAGKPALLAVDGPRGPRARVHLGVIALARRTGAVIVPVVAVPSRRWVLHRSWDRFQIPKPFSRICLAFAEPYLPRIDEDVQTSRAGLQARLVDLETRYDSQENQAHHAASIATP